MTDVAPVAPEIDAHMPQKAQGPQIHRQVATSQGDAATPAAVQDSQLWPRERQLIEIVFPLQRGEVNDLQRPRARARWCW